MASLPWYQDGLKFKCTGCGKCCTGAPGVVWVTDEEISAIAAHLELDMEEFSRRYLRKVEGRIALQEKTENWDCIFLEEGKCSIYAHRPTQCRTYPWWPSNLTSPEAWKRAAAECEGISEEAPLVPIDEIEAGRRNTSEC